jgi:hypothetical protein
MAEQTAKLAPEPALPRRKKWEVIVPENAGQPKPHDVIKNPSTGEDAFGQIPAIEVPNGPSFPAGEVILFHGRRSGDKGFGVVHAWHRHFPSAKTLEDATVQVSSFIVLVLVSGTKILYEHVPDRSHRLTMLQSTHGVVIVEHRIASQRGDFYSVVTAIPGKQNANGSLVGAVL